MSVTEIVQLLKAKRSGEGWKAKCPAHDDRVPSLSIKEGSGGRILLHCHAGCSVDDILRALGMTRRDLFPAGTPPNAVSSPKASAPKQEAATDAKPAPVKPKRERIEKLAKPSEPVTFKQWRNVIATNFPALVRPAEVCLNVVAQLLLNDISNPFALALVDVPSSGKTITLNFFSGINELTYTSDNFTPASFVSHSSNVKREQLDDVDLLPRIQYRTLVVRELGSVFGAKEDDLIKQFGILTRVLDGEGLQTDSGVHGRRGYTGDFLFMLLGGTPPIAPRVFKIMGNFGSRLFLLELHTPEEEESDLIAQNRGADRKQRETVCRETTQGFLRTLWADNPDGVTWNKADDPEDCLRVIAKCATLLASLRGAINVWPVGEDGRLTHSIPTIEKPNRINCLFYNLARAHALICGRRQITTEDLWPVLDLTLDSCPRTRAKLFRGLIEAGGTLTTTDVVKLLRCSPPTARKEMEALSVLAVVQKTEFGYDSNGQKETEITLDRRFEWFASEECKALMKGEHTPPITAETGQGEILEEHTQGGNSFSPTQTDHAKPLQSGGEKEIAPSVCVPHDLLVDLVDRLNIEIKNGLCPKGRPDCAWGVEYPHEYTSALQYVRSGNRDEEEAFDLLSHVVSKIETTAWRGMPLSKNGHDWSDGSYPAEHDAARAYLDEAAKKSPFPDMTDKEWIEYEAQFNASKTIYPGDWIKLNPDETQEHWLTALKEALEKPCEVCGEQLGNEPHLWFHRLRRVARCPNCQEAHWFADGYEIDEYGLPSCWNHGHTCEERIAERERNQIQKAARYRARVEGREYAAVYQDILSQESEETRRMIEALCEKEKEERAARAARAEAKRGMTPGGFIAEATRLFKATPAQ
jgi:hypothetical protein